MAGTKRLRVLHEIHTFIYDVPLRDATRRWAVLWFKLQGIRRRNYDPVAAAHVRVRSAISRPIRPPKHSGNCVLLDAISLCVGADIQISVANTKSTTKRIKTTSVVRAQLWAAVASLMHTGCHDDSRCAEIEN